MDIESGKSINESTEVTPLNIINDEKKKCNCHLNIPYWIKEESINIFMCCNLILCFIFGIFVIFVIVFIIGEIDEMNEERYRELVNNTKIVVNQGYWIDKDIYCTINNPCIMNCEEYNRYDIQCAKDNPDCTMGRYDYCNDEPVGNMAG